jgi:hypothetical protein
MATYPDPRILICALGAALAPMKAAAVSFRGETAFTVDEDYSEDEADDRMEQSFGVCWDRVATDAYDETDEAAVEEHGAVVYLLSPPMPQHRIVGATADALFLIEHLLANGATAVKIENAGIAHGVARWRALAEAARRAPDAAAKARVVRDATMKPIGGDRFYESIGHHLAGIPEVYVPIKSVRSERDGVRRIQTIGDELLADGVEAVLARHGATLARESQYEGDFEFKINPWGVVMLPPKLADLAIKPSRPGL